MFFHPSVVEMLLAMITEYMSNFEKFKEQLPSKEKFYSLLTGRKISSKEYKHVNVL